MSSGLYIGRFQPLHNGHVDSMRQVLEREDRLIVGIGSSNVSGTDRNPYTAEFRERLIRAVLDENPAWKDRYTVVHVPDIGDYPRWPAHVVQTVHNAGEDFGAVYTAEPLTKALFEQYSAVPIVDLKKNIEVCATEVRLKMLHGEDWQSLVPKPVATIIEMIT